MSKAIMVRRRRLGSRRRLRRHGPLHGTLLRLRLPSAHRDLQGELPLLTALSDMVRLVAGDPVVDAVEPGDLAVLLCILARTKVGIVEAAVVMIELR